MKNFKKKMTRLKIGAGLAGVFFIFACVFVLFDFGSGLAINSYTDAEDRRNAIKSSTEDFLLQQLDNGSIDEEYINNMYFTKENFRAILEAIADTKSYRAERETDIYYEYYVEEWKKVLVPATYDDLGNVIRDSYYEWRWVRYVTEEPTPVHYSAADIEENPEINPFGLYWQPIYALCQMQSLDMYDDEYEGWKDYTDEATGEFIVQQRLDMESVQAAINVFNMQFQYVYDASADGTVQWQETTDLSKVPVGTVAEPAGYQDAEGNDIYKYKVVGEAHYKWTPSLADGGLINGGDSFERICYTLKSSDTLGHTEEDMSFWEYQPPEGQPYKREIRKIPTTVLSHSYNGYSSHKWYTEENDIKVNKFHYKYEKECEKRDAETKWSNNLWVTEEVDFVDVEKFYQACKRVCSSFDWEEFIMILETLPDSDELVEFYREMYENWKTYSGATISQTLRAGDEGFDIGEHVVVGWNVNQKRFTQNGNYVMPGFGDFNEDLALNTTLKGSDGLTYDQFLTLITSYPGIVSHSDSVLLIDPEGCAQALYDIQEEFDVSALGLFSIACLESGWGTSRICKDKANFVGWQAYDDTPYSSSTNFGNNDYAAGLYKCLRLIARNYTYRSTYHGGEDQDTYYLMRYSPSGTHNYCTSTSWPHSNSLIRAQFEKFLNINGNRFELNGYSAGSVGDRDYINPLDGTAYRISSGFGVRDAPTAGASTNHRGIDMAAPKGSPIYAIAEGTVVAAGYHYQMGYYVIINHGQWIDDKLTFTKYMHMDRLPSVSRNDYIGMHQPIGVVGSTGVSTGDHLHLTVTVGGDDNKFAVDPQELFGF